MYGYGYGAPSGYQPYLGAQVKPRSSNGSAAENKRLRQKLAKTQAELQMEAENAKLRKELADAQAQLKTKKASSEKSKVRHFTPPATVPVEKYTKAGPGPTAPTMMVPVFRCVHVSLPSYR